MKHWSLAPAYYEAQFSRLFLNLSLKLSYIPTFCGLIKLTNLTIVFYASVRLLIMNFVQMSSSCGPLGDSREDPQTTLTML